MSENSTNRRMLRNDHGGMARCVMCGWPIGDPEPTAVQPWSGNDITVHEKCVSTIDRERLDLLAERMKVEITEAIAEGVFPPDVADFSTLHSYMDANTLAGLCDDGDNDDVDIPGLAYAQEIVDKWLKAGRPGSLATEWVVVMRQMVMPFSTEADFFSDPGGEMESATENRRRGPARELTDAEHAAIRYAWEMVRGGPEWRIECRHCGYPIRLADAGVYRDASNTDTCPGTATRHQPPGETAAASVAAVASGSSECKFCGSLIDWQSDRHCWEDSSGAYRCEDNDVDCVHVPKRGEQ